MRLAVVAVTIALCAARASAQPLPFLRHDGGSFVDVRLAYAHASMPDVDETTDAIDVSAQYLIGVHGGIYGAIGAARVDSPGYVLDHAIPRYVDYHGTTPLDLELGGVLRYHDDDGGALTLGAGLSVPTVINLDGLYRPGAGFTEYAEPTDGVRSVNRFALRTSITPSLRRGGFVLAGHAGIDVAPSAADPVLVDAAIDVGAGERTSVVFGLGGYHTLDLDRRFSQTTTLMATLQLGHRFGRADVWLGGRVGMGQLVDVGVALEAGARVAL